MARTTPHQHVRTGRPLIGGEPLYRRVAAELLGELRAPPLPPREQPARDGPMEVHIDGRAEH
ncbi:hypothetical protein ACFWI2_19040, partial [Streptomyces pseudogriseolus]